MKPLDYVIARLREDGTIRSLAIVCLAIQQGRMSEEAISAAIWTVLGILSAYSAMKPSSTPQASPAGPSQ